MSEPYENVSDNLTKSKSPRKSLSEEVLEQDAQSEPDLMMTSQFAKPESNSVKERKQS